MNPIAQHEADQEAGRENNESRGQAAVPPALNEEIATHVDGDPVITELCPTQVTCPDNHVHIYAESGPRKAKVCLNGKEVCVAIVFKIVIYVRTQDSCTECLDHTKGNF